MSIDKRHSSIVYISSFLAAGIGLIFGLAPGADIGFLMLLWSISIFRIIHRSDADLHRPTLRFFLVMITVGFVISLGIEIVSALTLPLFYVINPLLNYFATYRILRTTSKLFAKNDNEELFSSFGAGFVSVLGKVFGISDD